MLHPVPLHSVPELLPQLRHDRQLHRVRGAAVQTGHRQAGHCLLQRGQLGELPEVRQGRHRRF